MENQSDTVLADDHKKKRHKANLKIKKLQEDDPDALIGDLVEDLNKQSDNKKVQNGNKST